jgi:hypothetical protein
MSDAPPVDDPVRAYLEELTRRLLDVMGERLLSVAAVGSVALGAYERGRSDIDVMVVIDQPLTVADWDAVVDLCSHEALPVPGRKLELVAYTRAQVAAPRRSQRWELNFNSGPGVLHAGFDPYAEPWHWFVLDLAQARHHAVTLHGEDMRSLIGEVPDELVSDAHSATLAWYALHEPGPYLLIAGARAWRWKHDGAFVSKAEAWAWALERMRT